MLASLLRPKKRREQIDQPPRSPYTSTDYSQWFRAARRRGLNTRRSGNSSDEDMPELQDIDEDIVEHWGREEEDEDEEEEEEDGPLESTPLLPIFSASHLGTAFRRCWKDHTVNHKS